LHNRTRGGAKLIFTPTVLNTVINIKEIITIHYFEHAKDFNFGGEKHDFWELVYIVKGRVGVMADTTGYSLKEGEVIFHRPNEYHNIWADKADTNVIIITFVCNDPAMNYFNKKILNLNYLHKNILSLILKEAKETFSGSLDILYQTKMTKKNHTPFGSEQLIKTYLEQLLISLIRFDTSVSKETDEQIKSVHEDRIIEAIIIFLKSNINRQLCLDDICKNICFSKSYIKQLFKRKKQQGIMQYFIHLKIKEAKRLIKEGAYNFTQISEMLGFSSVHYFSRVFKNKTGLSPRMYLK